MLTSNFKLKIRSGESFLYRKEDTESQVFELRMRNKVSHFALQRALHKALKRYPYFNSSFKVKGESVFLVRNKVKPAVERRLHLRPLGGVKTQRNMLDVTFYERSIFVAFHHGICDGRGIMPFIKTLMYYYLRNKYNHCDLYIPDVRLVGEEMLHGETSDPVRDGNFAFDPEKVFRVDRTGFALPGVDQEGLAPTLNYRYEYTFELEPFMQVCKQCNCTPPILVALLVQRAVIDVCPLADKPITCFLTCDWREHIGLPNTFRNCVSSIYLPYTKDDHGKPLQQLGTEYRELIARQKELNSGRCSASIIKYLSDTLDKLPTYEEKSVMAERHPYRYTIRPNVGASFGQFTSNWDDGGVAHSYSLMSAPIFKVGCSVSVLGITAGIHRDVKRLLGKTEETEYSLSGYSPVVGGELAYNSSYTHTMSCNADGETLWQLPLEGCRTRRFLANGYVVLNPRRFSLPATITQRYNQRRSAGSPIVGASLTGFRMDVDVTLLPPQLTEANSPYEYARNIIHTTASLSAGYAYNWVLPDNWMLHASYLHTLSLYHYGEIAFAEHTLPLGHKTNQGGIVRLGSVWDIDRYFGGFTGTMQMQWMSFSPIYTFDFYVRTHLFFGFRF